MLSILGWSLAISLVINGIMFLVAFRLKSDKLTDASYALTFIALGLFYFFYAAPHTYNLVGLGMIFLWAFRIGSFLLYRVIQAGKDQRFDEIREDFWRFGKFWLGQAATVWVLMIPAALAFTHGGDWNLLVHIGIAVWLLGFLIESIADFQKYQFTSNPSHKNQWINTGIWQYSRHPNYFGEILVWVGIYVYALPHLTTTEALVAFASPLYIMLLLLFVSGVPILEKSADKRWANQPAYREYKRRTSLLIPLSKKKL